MTAIWMFEGGRLEARNEAGELLRWWLADEAMGWPLAGLLKVIDLAALPGDRRLQVLMNGQREEAVGFLTDTGSTTTGGAAGRTPDAAGQAA